ncbi:MAG: S9 family peptidase [Undibacterium sp.]|nr:S9 family peptidase [Undibacterium sp.]
MPKTRHLVPTVLISALTFICVNSNAHDQKLSTADYDKAVASLAPKLNPLVVGGTASATWLPTGRFVYRSTRLEGTQFLIADPKQKSLTPYFDHSLLALAVNSVNGSNGSKGSNYKASSLPLQNASLTPDAKKIKLNLDGKILTCELASYQCSATEMSNDTGNVRARANNNAVTSPDGQRAAFIKDHNLWIRDIATKAETQLTTDGVKDFGYATDNAGWVKSDRAILLWSPDSKKIATQKQDERQVGEMYMVETKVGHPVLHAWKYPLPGDEHIQMLERVVIDVDSKTVVRLKMDLDPHRATIGDNITMADYNWSPDSKQLALVSTPRDHKAAILRVADTNTGEVRTVFEERVKTQFESRTGWRVLWNSNEVIWYSQRDDIGQLYLYDLNSGKLKNQITNTSGPVTNITRIDEKNRTLSYVAMGSESGQDPYYRHFYRVNLNGKNTQSLSPKLGDHDIQLAPDGQHFIDTYSKFDAPPVADLLDQDGKLVMPLEKADISQLSATGWQPPMSFSVKAADGKTDIYGYLFRPKNFDPNKKYPIINNAYPGPQSGSVGSRSFAATYGDKQALAELGFIVVAIDGRGTPGRSKSFHDAYYGAMGRDNTLPDQVAGMQALAKKYSWIDIDKAAMWGHSGGGFITVDAMFRYPDFFKVGIAESGNHDQRNYEDDWGERYQGLLVKNDVKGENGAPDNYEAEANWPLAKNLKGKLLLAHGTLDNNVPPENTYLVADALIKANKEFDMLMIPNAAHGFGAASNYMMRRRWDYFVRWLLEAEPPKNYEVKTNRP